MSETAGGAHRVFHVLVCAFAFGSLFAAPTQAAQSIPAAKAVGGITPTLKPKSVLAIGATLAQRNRLWIVRVVNGQLLVSYSDDSGNSFSEPAIATPKPESILADGENRPKIAVSQDGTVLLSWTVALPKAYSGNVRFARSVDGGKSFSQPVTLNDDGRITSHRFESLAIGGKGRVAVIWLDARDRDAAKEKGGDFRGVSVYGTQSTDNGAHFSPNRKRAEHTCECCRTSLMWTSHGPVAIWRSIYGANTRDFAIANLEKGEVRRATDDDWQVDACPHHGGSLATSGDGVVHMTWFTQGKKRQGLFYQRITGEEASLPIPIGDKQKQAGHALIAAAGSAVLISWREFDGNGYTAQVQRSDDGGTTWTAPRTIAATKGSADYPFPLINGKHALVVWNTDKDGLLVLPAGSGANP